MSALNNRRRHIEYSFLEWWHPGLGNICVTGLLRGIYIRPFAVLLLTYLKQKTVFLELQGLRKLGKVSISVTYSQSCYICCFESLKYFEWGWQLETRPRLHSVIDFKSFCFIESDWFSRFHYQKLPQISLIIWKLGSRRLLVDFLL